MDIEPGTWKKLLHEWSTWLRDFLHELQERSHHGANQRTVAILILVILPLALLYVLVVRAPANFPSTDIITIPQRESVTAISEELAAQHVVRSADALKAVIYLLGGTHLVHAGDYQFSKPLNVFVVANRIIHGYYGLEPTRIRIPEGATVTEMADIFAKKLPRFDKQAFIDMAKPHEGYLFPDTYFFLPNADAQRVYDTLRAAFDSHITTIMPQIEASGHSLKDIVIMASILEKEAHIYKDRRMISGVLWNRIKINMPLQVDATFLYIMGKSTFDLTLQDLQVDSPYNTYKYKGLPPGPIDNPSLSALTAAADPIKSDYLFYLADNNGNTYYSKTYAEHLRKKQLYIGP